MSPRLNPLLAADLTGQGKPQAIVFVHGFLGNSGDWFPLVQRFKKDFQCVTVDLPGHGKSRNLEVKNMEETVEHLIQTVFEHVSVPFWLVGYSLGARVCMLLCAKRSQVFKDKPCQLRGLMIESGHPGLLHPEKKMRKANDEAWACRFEEEPLRDVLDDWYSQAVFSSLNDLQKQNVISKRSKNNAGSSLAKMLRATSLSTQACLALELEKSEIPFYYLCGEKDLKFSQIGRALKCPFYGVKQAGHNAHHEQPERFSLAMKKIITNSNKGIQRGKNRRTYRRRVVRTALV